MYKQLLSVLLLCVLWMPAAFADEIENTIKEANQAYRNKNYSLSLERLEQAMNLIKDVQAAKIIQFFPKPLKGWHIATPEKDTTSPIPNVQLGMFSSVLQRYKKDSENSENLLADKSQKDQAKTKKQKEPWVQFTLLQNPNGLIKMGFQGMHALRAANPEAVSIPVDGYAGILYCDEKKATCDVFFDFDGKFMLMVNAENTSKEVVTQYVKAFDVDGLLSEN